MSSENTPSKHPHVKIIRRVVPDPIEPGAGGHDAFHHISQNITNRLGSPTALAFAVLIIVVWIFTGPFFNFSDTWQLVINTTTTIVTFLMVFAIQNTQNRDAKAMQLKLNELINASRGARTEFVDIEDLSDTELDVLQDQFKVIHEKFVKHSSKSKKSK
jgi:low affinity Fe/Cu permease